MGCRASGRSVLPSVALARSGLKRATHMGRTRSRTGLPSGIQVHGGSLSQGRQSLEGVRACPSGRNAKTASEHLAPSSIPNCSAKKGAARIRATPFRRQVCVTASEAPVVLDIGERLGKSTAYRRADPQCTTCCVHIYILVGLARLLRATGLDQNPKTGNQARQIRICQIKI